MSVLSLILGVVGGALGIFSIVVTWRLYQAGMEANRDTMRLLSQIHADSHTTEITSTRFTERLVEGLIGVLSRDVRSTLLSGRATLEQRIDAALAEVLRDASEDVAQRLRGKVKQEVTNAFRLMDYQTAAAARLPEPEVAGLALPRSHSTDVVAPGVIRLIKWMAAEEPKHKFLSVKRLRQTVFASDPVLQEALQFGIDQGILILYKQPNPVNPAWPTTACQLNRQHPTVQSVIAIGHGPDEGA